MRYIKIVLIYSAVLVLGYFGTGLLFYYFKPEVKLLPKFVENLIHTEQPWEIKYPEIQDLEGFQYTLLHEDNNDATIPILFTDDYQTKDGIFCFRGNPQRDAPTRSSLAHTPTQIVKDWEFTTAVDNRVSAYGSWGGGSGWTGQPLLVQWDEKVWAQFANPILENAPRTEVIVGSLAGEIYFLDFQTGKPTRKPLSIGNPIKGTVSVDPRMNGLLYVGQGIPNGERFGDYVFDMFRGEEIYFRNGLDPQAYRAWGAFDSNPLIDLKSGCWIQPAENGLIYKCFVDNDGTISDPVKFKYTTSKIKEYGLEASFGAWNNLGWFADNSGNLFCLNLMSMKPIWWQNTTDDTDASIVVDIEDPLEPKLFVGNEVDKQGATGFACIRKYDGLTGKELWKVTRTCTGTAVGGRTNSGGVLATPLLGKHKAANLVYGLFSRIDKTMRGELIAIDKDTGSEKFVVQLDNFSWASPIALYDREGNAFLFCTDVYGGIYLIDGLTGELIFKDKMSCVWESSPVAWGNRIVLGSRGNKIYSFLIK